MVERAMVELAGFERALSGLMIARARDAFTR